MGMIDSLLAMFDREYRCVSTEADTALLRFSKSKAGTLGYQPALFLSESGEYVELEVRGVGHVCHDQPYTLLHDPGDEADFAGKAIELGDQHFRSETFGGGDRLPEHVSRVRLPGLDLYIVPQNLIIVTDESVHQ